MSTEVCIEVCRTLSCVEPLFAPVRNYSVGHVTIKREVFVTIVRNLEGGCVGF
jgi:hypothetical protein